MVVTRIKVSTMANDVLIKVEHLTRYYGSKPVVDDLCFALNKGQIVGFLGPNGAGKSTTMQMLAGVLAPDRGCININGYDLLDQPCQAKEAIGYLPEEPPLYREMTVNEQLHYSARLHRLDRTAIRRAVDRVKARCGLIEVSRCLTGNLSKGYRQRVGIAQALLHNPPLVILDEPTIGLDPIQRREIRQLIAELGEEHSVILSTHLLADVETICTDVQIMVAGRLVYASPLAALEPNQHSTCLRIRLNKAPPIATLDRIPGVYSVEALENGQFRLHHAPGLDLYRDVIEQARVGDWDLCELVRESVDLERIFIELSLDKEPL